jgi:hypothetical protein
MRRCGVSNITTIASTSNPSEGVGARCGSPAGRDLEYTDIAEDVIRRTRIKQSIVTPISL